MDIILKFEVENKIELPRIYKKFYDRCLTSLPEKLVGTHISNRYFDLKEAAIELINEDGIENFLLPRHFVFMMHQGYMFWYFEVDGNDDPVVYGYYEGKFKPDPFCNLSEFLNEFTSP